MRNTESMLEIIKIRITTRRQYNEHWKINRTATLFVVYAYAVYLLHHILIKCI